MGVSCITSNRSVGGSLALLYHHAFACPCGLCLDGRGAGRGGESSCNLQRSYRRNLHRSPHYHRGCGHLWKPLAAGLGRVCICKNLQKGFVKHTIWKHTEQVGRWTRVVQEPCKHEETGSS